MLLKGIKINTGLDTITSGNALVIGCFALCIGVDLLKLLKTI
ncbi:hypothetical protein [Aquimarina algiphila]|nr:hypothetical protein [Aquimarina algiphila]